MHGEHETVGEKELAGTFEAVTLRPSQSEGQMQGVRRACVGQSTSKSSTAKTQCMQTAEKGHSGEILERGGSLPEGDGNDSSEIKQLRGQI